MLSAISIGMPAPTAIDLGLPDRVVQGLRRAPDLRRERHHRLPARRLPTLRLEDHPHRALAHLVGMYGPPGRAGLKSVCVERLRRCIRPLDGAFGSGPRCVSSATRLDTGPAPASRSPSSASVASGSQQRHPFFGPACRLVPGSRDRSRGFDGSVAAPAAGRLRPGDLAIPFANATVATFWCALPSRSSSQAPIRCAGRSPFSRKLRAPWTNIPCLRPFSGTGVTPSDDPPASSSPPRSCEPSCSPARRRRPSSAGAPRGRRASGSGYGTVMAYEMPLGGGIHRISSRTRLPQARKIYTTACRLFMF